MCGVRMVVARSVRMRCLTWTMKMMICCICIVSWIRSSVASLSHPICPAPPAAASQSKQFPVICSLLSSQCPLSFHPNSVLHVNDDFLERILTSKKRNSNIALLFHASWSPFSESARRTFDVLSSMYPHIDHLAVEQSSAMPSLLSQFGIHSLPAIVMVNQNSKVRYHGSKDLDSLVEFYKQTTGSEPVQCVAMNQSGSAVTSQKLIMQSWVGSSMKEILTREPYLIFSVLFLFVRVLVYIIPRVLYHFKVIWASYRPQLNLEIFGETSQILGRILHMIDVKGVWTNLRLCKNRNFRRGARNARVWASSLASVSLGETSTSRLSS